MKITPVLVLLGLLAGIILVFVRLNEVRRLDAFYNNPKLGVAERDQAVRIATYRVSPKSIPIGNGNLNIRGCWTEAEMTIPFLGWGDNRERNGKVRLVLDTEDGASAYGVEQRLKIGGEYAKQTFVQDDVAHRLAWRSYENEVPRIVLIERRTEDGQLAVNLMLTKQ